MKISDEQGFSSLFAAGLIVLLSLFGFAITSLVSTAQSVHSDQLLYDRAFYVTQSGIEYAMRKIYEGASPIVVSPGINFSGGNFTIAREGRVVTVTGVYDTSRVVHSVTSPTEADCTDFDVSGAELYDDGTRLRHIQFRKICLEQAVLDKMVVSWTDPGPEGLRRVRVESSTLYNEPPVPSGDTTELANYIMTGDNMNNMNEVRFSSDMEDKTFTINFQMGDGSSESYTFTPDD
ncbi:MAG: hypothetical protein HY542_02595 [Deltaproteobacteria bacterium]|nr:hypothetical protein [Deltaproteobacteria bacterium]